MVMGILLLGLVDDGPVRSGGPAPRTNDPGPLRHGVAEFRRNGRRPVPARAGCQRIMQVVEPWAPVGWAEDAGASSVEGEAEVTTAKEGADETPPIPGVG